jgi:hypothetical protein
VIVRLAPGDRIQAMVPNRGDEREWRQGTPVSVSIPPAAIRVLAADDRETTPSDDEEGSQAAAAEPG